MSEVDRRERQRVRHQIYLSSPKARKEHDAEFRIASSPGRRNQVRTALEQTSLVLWEPTSSRDIADAERSQRELDRAMSGHTNEKAWSKAHKAVKKKKGELKAAAANLKEKAAAYQAALDKAAKAKPGSLEKFEAEEDAAGLGGQLDNAVKEFNKKQDELDALLMAEELAQGNGQADCSARYKKYCENESNHKYCEELNCAPDDDCVCTLVERSSRDEWTPPPTATVPASKGGGAPEGTMVVVAGWGSGDGSVVLSFDAAKPQEAAKGEPEGKPAKRTPAAQEAIALKAAKPKKRVVVPAAATGSESAKAPPGTNAPAAGPDKPPPRKKSSRGPTTYAPVVASGITIAQVVAAPPKPKNERCLDCVSATKKVAALKDSGASLEEQIECLWSAASATVGASTLSNTLTRSSLDQAGKIRLLRDLSYVCDPAARRKTGAPTTTPARPQETTPSDSETPPPEYAEIAKTVARLKEVRRECSDCDAAMTWLSANPTAPDDEVLECLSNATRNEGRYPHFGMARLSQKEQIRELGRVCSPRASYVGPVVVHPPGGDRGQDDDRKGAAKALIPCTPSNAKSFGLAMFSQLKERAQGIVISAGAALGAVASDSPLSKTLRLALGGTTPAGETALRYGANALARKIGIDTNANAEQTMEQIVANADKEVGLSPEGAVKKILTDTNLKTQLAFLVTRDDFEGTLKELGEALKRFPYDILDLFCRALLHGDKEALAELLLMLIEFVLGAATGGVGAGVGAAARFAGKAGGIFQPVWRRMRRIDVDASDWRRRRDRDGIDLESGVVRFGPAWKPPHGKRRGKKRKEFDDRKSPAKWNNKRNAEELRENMGETKFRDVDDEAHHIVQSGAKDHYSVESRRILDRYEIDINDAENGVALHGPHHRHVHTNDQREYVYNALANAAKSAKTWREAQARVKKRLKQLGKLVQRGDPTR